MKLVPLGDQAALAYLPNEAAALSFATAVRETGDPWFVDVVQAYKSVAVFFDLGKVGFADVSGRLKSIWADVGMAEALPQGRLHHIPCCYDLQLDLSRVAMAKAITEEEVIRMHSSTEYTVYAIGFCPGFPYLGYLPEEISGVPRLETPRLKVEAGSVGLTGRQTGIYTEARPGGWNIIGRTPLELVNVKDGYFPLRTGDRVRFESIDQQEYQRLLGKRL